VGLERLELAEKSNQFDVALMVSVMANYDNIYRIRADFSRTLNEGVCPMRMMELGSG
jgi:hypothetical protein